MRRLWPFKPHYVREYRNMVASLCRADPEHAMERAVGGEYEAIGAAHVALLRHVGLSAGDYLIDVGCGSGRTAVALRDDATLRYLGTDVVPELLEHARARAARPDWQFVLVEELRVPAPDSVADMVVMFSIITHLSPQEGRQYVTDAFRVLKPGGKLIVSFLDETIPHHRNVIGGPLFQLKERLRGRSVKNVTSRREDLAAWAEGLGVRAPEFLGTNWIGQSCVVLTKTT